MPRDYHHMTLVERRDEQRRRHQEQFGRKTFRCIGCRTIVDEASSMGHLGRCAAMVPGSDGYNSMLAAHFEVVVLAKKTARGK